MVNRLAIVLAVAGWALYGFSVLAPRSPGSDTQAEVARLSKAAETANAERDKLAAELAQIKSKGQDLQHIQKRIAAATQELKHLEYLRSRVSGEIDALHPRPVGGSSPAPTIAEPPVPSNVTSTPPSREEISEVQRSLTRLGYGPLEADGILGRGTRRSIEAFQRDRGLTVSGQLDPDTLKAIKDSRTAAVP